MENKELLIQKIKDEIERCNKNIESWEWEKRKNEELLERVENGS